MREILGAEEAQLVQRACQLDGAGAADRLPRAAADSAFKGEIVVIAAQDHLAVIHKVRRADRDAPGIVNHAGIHEAARGTDADAAPGVEGAAIGEVRGLQAEPAIGAPSTPGAASASVPRAAS